MSELTSSKQPETDASKQLDVHKNKNKKAYSVSALALLGAAGMVLSGCSSAEPNSPETTVTVTANPNAGEGDKQPVDADKPSPSETDPHRPEILIPREEVTFSSPGEVLPVQEIDSKKGKDEFSAMFKDPINTDLLENNINWKLNEKMRYEDRSPAKADSVTYYLDRIASKDIHPEVNLKAAKEAYDASRYLGTYSTSPRPFLHAEEIEEMVGDRLDSDKYTLTKEEVNNYIKQGDFKSLYERTVYDNADNSEIKLAYSEAMREVASELDPETPAVEVFRRLNNYDSNVFRSFRGLAEVGTTNSFRNSDDKYNFRYGELSQSEDDIEAILSTSNRTAKDISQPFTKNLQEIFFSNGSYKTTNVEAIDYYKVELGDGVIRNENSRSPQQEADESITYITYQVEGEQQVYTPEQDDDPEAKEIMDSTKLVTIGYAPAPKIEDAEKGSVVGIVVHSRD